MNPDQGTELRSGRVINSSSETSSPIDPDMAQSSANDSDTNDNSGISSQLSEIKESYERRINELHQEFSQLKVLMMAVVSKTNNEPPPSSSKGPSKPAQQHGFDMVTGVTDPAPPARHPASQTSGDTEKTTRTKKANQLLEAMRNDYSMQSRRSPNGSKAPPPTRNYYRHTSQISEAKKTNSWNLSTFSSTTLARSPTKSPRRTNSTSFKAF